MTYYRQSEEAADHQATGYGNKAHAGGALSDGNRAELPAKRPYWAWAVAKGHHDWMDSHTPLAHHD